MSNYPPGMTNRDYAHVHGDDMDDDEIPSFVEKEGDPCAGDDEIDADWNHMHEVGGMK